MNPSENLRRKSILRNNPKYSKSIPQHKRKDLVRMEHHSRCRNHTYNPQQEEVSGVLVPTYRTQTKPKVNLTDPWLCPINGSQLSMKQIPPKKKIDAKSNRPRDSKHTSDSLMIDNMFYREEEDQSVRSSWSSQNLLPSGSPNLSFKSYYRSKKNHRHSGSNVKQKNPSNPKKKELQRHGKISGRSRKQKHEAKTSTSTILPKFIKPLASRHSKSKVKIESNLFDTEHPTDLSLFERSGPITTHVKDLDINSLCYCNEAPVIRQTEKKNAPMKMDVTGMKFSSFVDIPGTNIPLHKYECQHCNGFILLSQEGFLYDFGHLYPGIGTDQQYFHPNLSCSEDSKQDEHKFTTTFSRFHKRNPSKTSLIPKLHISSSKIPFSKEEKWNDLNMTMSDFHVPSESTPANKNTKKTSKREKEHSREKAELNAIKKEFDNDPSPQSSAHKFLANFEPLSQNDAIDTFAGRNNQEEQKDSFRFHRKSHAQDSEYFHRERRENYDQNDFRSNSPTRQTSDHVITFNVQDEVSKPDERGSTCKSKPQHYTSPFPSLALPNFSQEQELDEDGFILNMPDKYSVAPQYASCYPISFDYSGENFHSQMVDDIQNDISQEYGFHMATNSSNRKSNNFEQFQSTPTILEPSMFNAIKQKVSIDLFSFDDPFEKVPTISGSNLETNYDAPVQTTDNMNFGFGDDTNQMTHIFFNQSSIENPYTPIMMNDFLDTVAAIVIQTEFRRFLAQMLALKRRWAIQTIQKTYRYYSFRKHSALKIQSCFRSWLVRDNLMVDHYCATRIQSCIRGFLIRKWMIKYYNNMEAIFKSTCAVIIQSCFRGYAFRKSIVEEACAHSIQMCWRSYKRRRYYKLYTKIVIRVQSIVRRFLVKQKMKRWNSSALKIQSRWRSYDCFLNYMHSLADILIAQSVARRWLVQKSIHNKLIKENVYISKNVIFSKNKPQCDQIADFSENSNINAIEILKRWRKSKGQIENSPILFVHPRRARISRFERTQGISSIICDDPSLLLPD